MLIEVSDQMCCSCQYLISLVCSYQVLVLRRILEQHLMCTTGNDLSILQNDNLIGVPDRVQAMGNDEYNTLFHHTPVIARSTCSSLSTSSVEVASSSNKTGVFFKNARARLGLRPCGGMWRKIHAILPSKMRKRRCCRLR